MSRRPTDPPAKPARPPRAAKPAKPAEAPAKATGERIAKVLSRAGVASRRDAERMIAEGRVAVNGKLLDSPARDVTPKDRITVDGQPLAPPEPPRVWLYHKPEGLVTTARDEQGRATVFDHLPEDLPRVMTVGRLDLNSEGLLLLTNDGGLKRRLELPSTGWLRKYRVRVNGRPEDSQFEPLRKGIVIEGEAFQPMTVTLDRQQGANAWLTVGIREGRNREIRRAMEAVGLAVNRLIRIGYGPFQLGDLPPGGVAEVRPRLLKDQLGLAETPMPTAPPPGGEGARRGPAGKPASRTAGAARDKPGPARPRAEGPAGPKGKAPATGARGLAASAERWLEKTEAASKPAAKPRPGRGAADAERTGPARTGDAKPVSRSRAGQGRTDATEPSRRSGTAKPATRGSAGQDRTATAEPSRRPAGAAKPVSRNSTGSAQPSRRPGGAKPGPKGAPSRPGGPPKGGPKR